MTMTMTGAAEVGGRRLVAIAGVLTISPLAACTSSAHECNLNIDLHRRDARDES
jgi:hypothetical protein